MDIKNLSLIRQSFANTVFTHKVQEIAVENQEKIVFIIKIINIILVTLVLFLFIFQPLDPYNPIYSFFGAGLTLIEIVFLIIQLSFSFEQRLVIFKNSALRFLGLRDEYRSLIVDIMNEDIDSGMIKIRRDLLMREYQIICEMAPQTSEKEYLEAQRRLNKRGVIKGEQFTWSDEEIDYFLPENIKLKNYEKKLGKKVS
jgi:hypothetical protein